MLFAKRIANHYRIIASEETSLVNEVKKALSEQKKSLLQMKSNIEKHNILNLMGEDTTDLKALCERVVFGENDVVEKILKKKHLDEDDVDVGELRDMQHDMIDEVCD